jgi:hypothetical protein
MESEATNTNSGIQSPRRKSETKTANGEGVSFDDQRKMFELAEKRGLTRKHVMDLLGQHGFEQPGDLTASVYKQICSELEA